MEVNNVNAANQATAAQAAYTAPAKNEKSNETAAANTTEKEKAAATYEKAPEKVTYKPDANKVEELIAESNNKVDAFRKMLQTLLTRQSKTFNMATGGLNKLSGEAIDPNALIDIDPETQAQAQKDIAEDGYYGVKQTSERILDFAKAVSGGDPKKIETLRKAVQDGFKAAEEVWGGKLPEISQKTYDAVMAGFDEWAKQSKTEPVA